MSGIGAPRLAELRQDFENVLRFLVLQPHLYQIAHRWRMHTMPGLLGGGLLGLHCGARPHLSGYVDLDTENR